jgi:hypothetical protein
MAQKLVLKAQQKKDPFDFEVAYKWMQEVREYALTFAGKAGYNPFTWLRDNHSPILKRYNDGERSEELFNTMMNLKKVEPSV